MGINYQTIKTKEDITNIINNSGLPAINVLFVLDSIRTEVTNIVNQSVEKEKEEITKEGDKEEQTKCLKKLD
jgi:hypothetical protein